MEFGALASGATTATSTATSMHTWHGSVAWHGGWCAGASDRLDGGSVVDGLGGWFFRLVARWFFDWVCGFVWMIRLAGRFRAGAIAVPVVTIVGAIHIVVVEISSVAYF